MRASVFVVCLFHDDSGKGCLDAIHLCDSEKRREIAKFKRENAYRKIIKFELIIYDLVRLRSRVRRGSRIHKCCGNNKLIVNKLCELCVILMILWDDRMMEDVRNQFIADRARNNSWSRRRRRRKNVKERASEWGENWSELNEVQWKSNRAYQWTKTETRFLSLLHFSFSLIDEEWNLVSFGFDCIRTDLVLPFIPDWLLRLNGATLFFSRAS